jgi:hypothetical protein
LRKAMPVGEQYYGLGTRPDRSIGAEPATSIGIRTPGASIAARIQFTRRSPSTSRRAGKAERTACSSTTRGEAHSISGIAMRTRSPFPPTADQSIITSLPDRPSRMLSGGTPTLPAGRRCRRAGDSASSSRATVT